MLSEMSNLKCVAKYFDFNGYGYRDLLSYEDLKIAVKKAGIFSGSQYRKKYKNFKSWPSNPNIVYKKEWKSWPNFFDREKRDFLSYEDLKIAVKKAGISSGGKYKKQYKNFKGWPSNPDIVYKKEWKGWADFFDKEKKDFLSYEDLKIAVKKAGISSGVKYKKQYKNFKGWPAKPNIVYKKEWKGWADFFDIDKKDFLSYEDLKIAVKKAGISSAPQYIKKYRNFKGWPSNPNTVYKKEWKGWPDLFDKR
jgi:Ca2+-binding EF-hand superfamily protein